MDLQAQELFDKAAAYLLAQVESGDWEDIICSHKAPKPLLESLSSLRDNTDPCFWAAGLVEISEVFGLIWKYE